MRSVAAILWVVFLCPSVVSEEFNASDYFSREEIERGAEFNRYLYLLFFGKEAAVIAFLGLVAWSSLASSYQRDIEKLCRGKRRVVLPVYAFFVLLMIRLVGMPFNAIRDLVVKTAFGLSRQGIAGWLTDQLKSFLAGEIWFLPLVLLMYAAMRRLKRTWWLVSAGAIGVALIAWFSLAPYLVEPLFYRITRVKSEALHAHFDPLLEKAGVNRNALYKAHSGGKTREVNAYLSGLFLGRRIVLYNVLAESADPSDLRFAVAHEIGHWKNHHVIKGIGFGTAGAAGCLLLLGALLKLTVRRKWQPGAGHYEPSSLPAFFFWLHVILFLIMPIECAISRRFETATDRYALELTHDPQGAVRLFQKVARMNLSDINPPPIVKFWLYTHPTIPERIEAALRAGEKSGSTITPRQDDGSPGKIPLRGQAPSPKASGSSASPSLPEPGSLVAMGAVNEVVVPGLRAYLDF